MNIGWMKHGPPMVATEAGGGGEAEMATEDGGGGEADYPHERGHLYAQPPAGRTNCTYTRHWEVFPLYTNIYAREPSPTNATHGTLKFIGLFDSADACFAAVNASAAGPFRSFTYNDATVLPRPYRRHCWADSSYTWQGRGGAKGQVSGRGPGFPLGPGRPRTARDP